MRMNASLRRIMTLGVAAASTGLVLLLASVAADDATKLEVHEWSFWILDLNAESANAKDRYTSALPVLVNSLRSRETKRDEDPLSPLTVMTFYGEPAGDVEVTVQTQAGQFVAHWPSAEVKNRRMRWAALSLTDTVPDAGQLAFVPDDHWFLAARKHDALWVNVGARTERFLAYDAEFRFPVPIKIERGPDRYQVANTGPTPLEDVAIIVPTPEGLRIGWLDKLPAAPAATAAPASNAAAGAPAQAAPKQADYPVKAKKAVPPAAPPPAQAPPTEKSAARAEAEQKLEKPITVQFVDTPLHAVVAFLHDLTGVNVRLDDAALKEAAITSDTPVKLEFHETALSKVLDELAKQVKGLGWQMDEKGTLMLTKAPPAEEPQAVPAASGPSIELTMSPPLAAGGTELQVQTRDALRERLGRTGLKPAEIDLLISLCARPVFESHEMVALFRLPAVAIDEKLPLEIFPEPHKTVRTALVLVRSIDPRMKDEVKALVARLGDPKYAEREAAEKRLIELGAVAVPVLKEALKDKDAEVVFRAERILLSRNEPIP